MIVEKFENNRLVIAYDGWQDGKPDIKNNLIAEIIPNPYLMTINLNFILSGHYLETLYNKEAKETRFYKPSITLPYFSAIPVLSHICEKSSWKDIIKFPTKKKYIPPDRHSAYKQQKLFKILYSRFTKLYNEILEDVALKEYRLDDIEKKIYALGGKKNFDWFFASIILDNPKILPDAYLKKDIKKYRGAGYAYVNAVRSGGFHMDLSEKINKDIVQKERGAYIITEEDFDWRKRLFVGDGQISKGTNRFLDACPGQVPLNLKIYWNTSHEPSRLYYVAHNVLADMRRSQITNREISVLERSTDSQIKKALKIAGCYNFRKASSLWHWFSHIFIVPAPHTRNCTLVGWAKHAVQEHERVRTESLEKKLLMLKNKGVALPKFPVDMTPLGLRQLLTPEELVIEGHEMGHCVGRYVDRAVAGLSFIFSLEYNNERATIEISDKGTLVQARGERNTDNDATKYASSEVVKYLEKMKEAQSPSVF